MAGLLALAGSASIGMGLNQEPGLAFEPASIFESAVTVAAPNRTSLSSWDRARLDACVTLASVSQSGHHSELDRRANCADQLGLDPSATQ